MSFRLIWSIQILFWICSYSTSCFAASSGDQKHSGHALPTVSCDIEKVDKEFWDPYSKQLDVLHAKQRQKFGLPDAPLAPSDNGNFEVLLDRISLCLGQGKLTGNTEYSFRRLRALGLGAVENDLEAAREWRLIFNNALWPVTDIDLSSYIGALSSSDQRDDVVKLVERIKPNLLASLRPSSKAEQLILDQYLHAHLSLGTMDEANVSAARAFIRRMIESVERAPWPGAPTLKDLKINLLSLDTAHMNTPKGREAGVAAMDSHFGYPWTRGNTSHLESGDAIWYSARGEPGRAVEMLTLLLEEVPPGTETYYRMLPTLCWALVLSGDHATAKVKTLDLLQSAKHSDRKSRYLEIVMGLNILRTLRVKAEAVEFLISFDAMPMRNQDLANYVGYVRVSSSILEYAGYETEANELRSSLISTVQTDLRKLLDSTALLADLMRELGEEEISLDRAKADYQNVRDKGTSSPYKLVSSGVVYAKALRESQNLPASNAVLLSLKNIVLQEIRTSTISTEMIVVCILTAQEFSAQADYAIASELIDECSVAANKLPNVIPEFKLAQRFESAKALIGMQDWQRASAYVKETAASMTASLISLNDDDFSDLYGLSALAFLGAGNHQEGFAYLEQLKGNKVLRQLATNELEDVLPLSNDHRQRLMSIRGGMATLETASGPMLKNGTAIDSEMLRVREKERLKQEYAKLRTELARTYPQYAAITKIEPIPFSSIPSLIEKDELFISFIDTGIPRDGALFAFVINGKREAEFIELGYDPNLGDAVEGFRLLTAYESASDLYFQKGIRVWKLKDQTYRVMENIPSPEAKEVLTPDEIGEYLSAILLKPLGGWIARHKSILLSADLSTSNLSFDVLPFNGKYLIESHDVSYIPSLSILARAKGYSQEMLSTLPSIYAMGNAIYEGANATSSRSRARQVVAKLSGRETPHRSVEWTDLPGTAKELDSIEKVFEGHKTLIKRRLDAAKEVVLADSKEATLKNYKYLLFSAHGNFDRTRPARSGIILSQRNLPVGSDGILTAAEIMNLKVSAEVTVLSACDTGVLDHKNPTPTWGLPYAFQIAGSKQSVVTLWPISDDESASFVPQFFKRIISGQSARAALSETKRAFLSSDLTRAPRYWGAFVLFGK